MHAHTTADVNDCKNFYYSRFWNLLLQHVIIYRRIIYQKISWVSLSRPISVSKCCRRHRDRQEKQFEMFIFFLDFNDKLQLINMFKTSPNWFIVLFLWWFRRKSTRKDKQLSFHFNRGFKCKSSHFHDSFQMPDEISTKNYSSKSNEISDSVFLRLFIVHAE